MISWKEEPALETISFASSRVWSSDFHTVWWRKYRFPFQ